MGKPSDKTPKIKAAIARGRPVTEIAQKYEVSTAYVYAVRKRMNATTLKAKKPAPVKVPVVDAAPVAPVVSPTPKERTFWNQIFNVFRGR